jgi:fatty-acyl-CoA synthase
MTSDIGLGNWMAQRAMRTPRSAALTFDAITWTYAELQLRIDRLATLLRDHGVARGDRVGFLGLNQPAFIETMFAAARLGAVFVPLNFRLSAGWPATSCLGGWRWYPRCRETQLAKC